ncbi:sensor histidine kinase [Pedobacter nutrimenti]|nr:histidine kinase [Pedobacter nutrimenti]
MKPKPPLKNMLRLSSYFSLAIALFTFLASLMEEGALDVSLYKFVFSFLTIGLLSGMNIVLMVTLKEKDPQDAGKCGPWFYVCSYLGSIVVVILINKVQNYLVANAWIGPVGTLRVKGDIVYLYLSLQTLLMNGVVLLLQNFIIVQDANNKTQLENSRLNASKSEAVHQLLLQQVHPHFLFNALNILKSLIKKDPPGAEEYLVRLSGFLRASLSSHKREVATLQEELKLCRDYLEMQKVRFGEALLFSFRVSQEKENSGVLPLFSLQPLLENAIKHNELTPASPLHIEIGVYDGWIRVLNNIQMKASTEDSTGSGLANLAERYALLSGDEIEIKDDGNTFSVSLKILNHENRNH